MEQVFQALIDRSRAPLDLKTFKTILGYKHRPKNRRRTKRPAEWATSSARLRAQESIRDLISATARSSQRASYAV